jgi:hypothetical protein
MMNKMKKLCASDNQVINKHSEDGKIPPTDGLVAYGAVKLKIDEFHEELKQKKTRHGYYKHGNTKNDPIKIDEAPLDEEKLIDKTDIVPEDFLMEDDFERPTDRLY